MGNNRVAQLSLLDRTPNLVIDGVSRAAAQVCNVPIAGLSVFSRSEELIRSSIGLKVRGWPLKFGAFQVIRQAPTSLLLVKDIAIDPRFGDDPANFGGSGVRFYAGVPIVGSNGHLLGLLFVGDVVPRSLSAEETDGLTRLAGLVNGLVGLPTHSSTLISFSLWMHRLRNHWQ